MKYIILRAKIMQILIKRARGSPFALVNAENCSETGAEIISPHYMVTRDVNVSTAPNGWCYGKRNN